MKSGSKQSIKFDQTLSSIESDKSKKSKKDKDKKHASITVESV